MSNEYIALPGCWPASRDPEARIAFHAGRYYGAAEFGAAVSHWAERLRAEPFPRYALYTEDAYPFAVLLFALFHAGKEAWIAGNNRPGTALQLQQLDCRLLGDWDAAQAFDYALAAEGSDATPLLPLNSETIRLVIFTSGSTGEPKPIEKRLSQLQREVAALEKLWGGQLGNAEVLATVSHQHIYGLLFRVLWPLAAGRCFHSPIYINPETLVNAIHGIACWVASPAHLKRLDHDSPWDGIAGLSAVFSSGGALPEAAREQIRTHGGQQVIEIYGSSETGGIGWRQQESAWRLFDGMRLSHADGRWWLHSPYLQKEDFQLDDQLGLQDDGRFILHGRLDRIVKIEEKRLSLTELERRLTGTPWVDDAYTVLIAKHRDVVGAAIVLTETGVDCLKNDGRSVLIKQLRAALQPWFEPVVLPRKWQFWDSMPLTPQGKIDQHLIKALLETDTQKLPQVQGVSIKNGGVKLKLRVPEELVYFPDHFAGYPILPGVVQIAWVEHFGRLFFAITQPFLTMEVIKFVKVIRPGDELTLELKWAVASDKLHFNIRSEQGSHGSGRLIYGAPS